MSRPKVFTKWVIFDQTCGLVQNGSALTRRGRKHLASKYLGVFVAGTLFREMKNTDNLFQWENIVGCPSREENNMILSSGNTKRILISMIATDSM